MKQLILLSFLLLALGCSDHDTGEPRVEEIFDETGTLIHQSKERTYHVHLPQTYYDKSDKLPLVFAFHGGGGSGDQFEQQSRLSEKADDAGFIIVYPDGMVNPNVSVRSWNAGKCCGANASVLNTDDVGFVSKLIDELSLKYRVDTERIYATGHSHGAMLCYLLADELSSKIAAIAPNAGNFQMESPYDPPRNVPVLQVISKLDENVIYAGGMTNGPGGQYNPTIDSCLTAVAQLAGCSHRRLQ